MALSLLPYFVAKLIVGMLSGRMLERWCPDDDVLANRHLVETLGEAPAQFTGMDKEAILRALAERIDYPYEADTILAQDYGIWRFLHDAYPRDSRILWLVVALMAMCCPIGIILLRNVIRSRENIDTNGESEQPEEGEAAGTAS
jgi:hypothetical protein